MNIYSIFKNAIVLTPTILGAIVTWLIILEKGDVLAFMPFFIGSALISGCLVFAIQPNRTQQISEDLLDDEMLVQNSLDIFRDKLMED